MISAQKWISPPNSVMSMRSKAHVVDAIGDEVKQRCYLQIFKWELEDICKKKVGQCPPLGMLKNTHFGHPSSEFLNTPLLIGLQGYAKGIAKQKCE